jgi:hypothetical protein
VVVWAVDEGRGKKGAAMSDTATQNVTGAARQAIGADDEASDWQLRPEQHAAALPPEAGALARVLRSERIREIMARYTENDQKAVRAQDLYKSRSTLAVWARLGAIIVGAFFLLPLGSWLSQASGIVTIGTGLQYLCLGVALLVTAYINTAGLFSRWMTARSEAEIARLALFDAVIEAEETPREGELALLPLKLEYLRRYQLDVQIRYYGGRGAQHKQAAGQNRRTVWTLNGLGLLAFAALIVFGADAFGFITLPWAEDGLHYAFLALGTVISGMLGTIAALSAMNLDERNAARYLVVHQNLKDLAGESLDRARAAAAEGDQQTVEQFADAVQRLISAEHQEWIVLRSHIQKPEDMVSVALNPVQVASPGGR